jgi:hypothetical protein
MLSASRYKLKKEKYYSRRAWEKNTCVLSSVKGMTVVEYK